MIKAAPQAVESASALWVSVFNLVIGLGALAGGVIVDALTLAGTSATSKPPVASSTPDFAANHRQPCGG
jgi:predicted MFS family arabinose efflux permease